jgi:hypothetical protein
VLITFRLRFSVTSLSLQQSSPRKNVGTENFKNVP